TGGDEGVLGLGVWLAQSLDIMKVNITGIARTSCNTTFAAPVTKAQTYSSPAVAAQVASTANCNVGDWITADPGSWMTSYTSVSAGTNAASAVLTVASTAGFKVGDGVFLAGENTAGWNGTYIVTAIGGPASVTISLNSTGLGAFAGAAQF